MRNKKERQLAIKEILLTQNVQSQDELLAILKKDGFTMTQATLSRDLKLLKVAKVPDNNGYRYIIPETPDKSGRSAYADLLIDGFSSIQFSGNLAVVKTLPGYANSFAAILDSAEPWEIIGTVAGDDTILIIMREGTTQTDLINSMVATMPKLKDKLDKKKKA